MLFSNVNAQITFDAAYTSTTSGQNLAFYSVKFGNMGWKYVLIDRGNMTIKIYNLNHSLNMTINIPASFGVTGNYYISHLSDNLFDLNNDVEYCLTTSSTSTAVSKFYIFKDNGTQMFFKDSATVGGSTTMDVLFNQSSVFFDGTTTKLKLNRLTGSGFIPNRFELYTLPGSLPCVSCNSGGPVASVGSNSEVNPQEPLFFPNPVNDQLKLKYEIPGGAQNADLKISDIEGRVLGEYRIDRTFNQIYLPSDFGNGLYFYSIYVDGKLVKTEKVILSK